MKGGTEMFDYSKLRGRIREKFGTQALFAAAMRETGLNFSDCVLSQKLNNQSEWDQAEMIAACGLLDILPEELHLYFFCVES
jgi:hypothetical protein